MALYRGPVVDWIRELNHDVNWRHLFGTVHKRLKDHELILRALALLDTIAEREGVRIDYKPPMSDFLNEYLKRNRQLKTTDTVGLGAAFAQSADLLMKAQGSSALRYSGALNAAHVDALFSNLMHLILSGSDISSKKLRVALEDLRDNTAYADYITRSTSHRDSVVGRLRIAGEALSKACE